MAGDRRQPRKRVAKSTIVEASAKNQPIGTSDSKPKVDGYDVLERIGEGGFGTVWKVLRHGRIEAMKVLTSFGTPGVERCAEFIEEMKALAQRTGRGGAHFVEIFGHGEAEFADGKLKKPFYTMEYMAGGNLLKVLANPAFNLEHRFEIVHRVAECVAELHDLRWVHLDLKPENILFFDNGSTCRPKLADMGGARRLRHQDDSGRAKVGTSRLFGTPAYMSPEFRRIFSGGKKAGRTDLEGVGKAADIFALGVILFEVLTGEFPFEDFDGGDESAEIIARGAARLARRLEKVQGISRRRTRLVRDLVRDACHPEVEERLRRIPDANTFRSRMESICRAKDPDNDESRYLKRVDEVLRRIHIPGIGDIPGHEDDASHRLHVPIPLYRFNPEHRFREIGYVDQEDDEKAKKANESVKLVDVIDQARQKKEKSRIVVLLGDPGSGKTTFLKQLAAHTATIDGHDEVFRRSVEAGMSVLPLFIRVADFRSQRKAPEETLTEFIRRRFPDEVWKLIAEQPDHPDLLINRLIRGPTLFLFDGLDEIGSSGDADRAADFWHDVVNLRDALPDHSHIVVSCRIEGWCPAATTESKSSASDRRFRFDAGAVLELQVPPLAPEQIDDFVRSFFERPLEMDGATMSDADRSEAAQNLIDSLDVSRAENTRIHVMAQNPLLLGGLLAVHHDRYRRSVVSEDLDPAERRGMRSLPRDRGTLYELWLKLLLMEWPKARRKADVDFLINDEDQLDHFRRALEPVAYRLQCENVRYTSIDRIVDLLSPFLASYVQVTDNLNGAALRKNKKAKIRRIVDRLRDESGLFMGFGPETMGFVHTTFREYLAAQWIAKNPNLLEAAAVESPKPRSKRVSPTIRNAPMTCLERVAFALEPGAAKGESPRHDASWPEVAKLVVAVRGRRTFGDLVRTLFEKMDDVGPHFRLLEALLTETPEDERSPTPFVDILLRDPGPRAASSATEADRRLWHHQLMAWRVLRRWFWRIQPQDPAQSSWVVPDEFRSLITRHPHPEFCWWKKERKDLTIYFDRKTEIEYVQIPAGQLIVRERKLRDFYASQGAILTGSNAIEIPSFLLARTPVTYRQWKLFLAHGGTADGYVVPPQPDDEPVVNVSWEDASAYCRWAGSKSKGASIELPFEWMWEYACRAAAKTGDYWCGDVAELPSVAWFRPNSPGDRAADNKDLGRVTVHPVGDKPANPFGLFDMHGNVWEWCANWFDGDQESRAHRGGSAWSDAEDAAAGYRGWYLPSRRLSDLGFRPARVITP